VGHPWGRVEGLPDRDAIAHRVQPAERARVGPGEIVSVCDRAVAAPQGGPERTPLVGVGWAVTDYSRSSYAPRVRRQGLHSRRGPPGGVCESLRGGVDVPAGYGRGRAAGGGPVTARTGRPALDRSAPFLVVPCRTPGRGCTPSLQCVAGLRPQGGGGGWVARPLGAQPKATAQPRWLARPGLREGARPASSRVRPRKRASRV
jgi:hypothetical protein